MKSFAKLGTLVVALFLSAGSAYAVPILDITDSVSLSDPTQQGRLSRDGVPSDWSGAKAFPGVINTGTTYHYRTYLLDLTNVGFAQFIQISIDSLQADMFISAYQDAYLPNSADSPNFGFNTNYLGDAGFSGDPFPGDPNFFQVIVPAGHMLMLVVNNTGASNLGVGEMYHLTVEAFADSEFTDPVPEPATMLLSATGLALIALKRARARARQ